MINPSIWDVLLFNLIRLQFIEKLLKKGVQMMKVQVKSFFDGCCSMFKPNL
jgi:hypothetical protein